MKDEKNESMPKTKSKGRSKFRGKAPQTKVEGKGCDKFKNVKFQPKPWANDPSWYNKYPDLLAGAANIANNSLPGISRTTQFEGSVHPFGQVAGLRIPVILTVGDCFAPQDAFNMQMKALWTELHRRYRGIGTYEYSDLAITLFAIVAVYAFLAEGERAYGITRNYQARNRHIPNAMGPLLNWNLSTVNADLANFRYQLNRLITKAQVFCLPKGFAMVDDVANLFSNIFKDRNGVKSQYFAYVNDCIWTYDPTTLSTGGAVLGDTVAAPWTSSSYLLKLESMIDALLGDDDVARICSDLLAAYDDAELVKLQYLPEEYIVEPVYDEMRSLQMHNATAVLNVAAAKHSSVVGTWPTTTDMVIYQVNGNVCSKFSVQTDFSLSLSTYYAPTSSSVFLYKGYSTGTGIVGEGQRTGFLCDTWHTDFDASEIAELTRMHTIVTRNEVIDSNTTHEYIETIVHGSYIVKHIAVLFFTNNAQLTGGNYENTSFFPTVLDNQSIGSGHVQTMFGLSQIDNAPLCYMIDLDGAMTDVGNMYILGDVDNIIYINDFDLLQIHNACLLSEWKSDRSIVK